MKDLTLGQTSVPSKINEFYATLLQKYLDIKLLKEKSQKTVLLLCKLPYSGISTLAERPRDANGKSDRSQSVTRIKSSKRSNIRFGAEMRLF